MELIAAYSGNHILLVWRSTYPKVQYSKNEIRYISLNKYFSHTTCSACPKIILGRLVRQLGLPIQINISFSNYRPYLIFGLAGLQISRLLNWRADTTLGSIIVAIYNKLFTPGLSESILFYRLWITQSSNVCHMVGA